MLPLLYDIEQNRNPWTKIFLEIKKSIVLASTHIIMNVK